MDALRSPPNTPVCRAPCRTATTDKIALFSNSVQKEVVSYVRSREMITTIRKVRWYMTCESDEYGSDRCQGVEFMDILSNCNQKLTGRITSEVQTPVMQQKALTTSTMTKMHSKRLTAL